MTRDKQLRDVDIDQAVEKRRLDQALNAKEFAVLAGISYSTAREWFRCSGFPSLRGFVFWTDFVDWRRAQVGLSATKPIPASASPPTVTPPSKSLGLPPRAARILAEVA